MAMLVDMESKWQSEKLWQSALRTQRNYLCRLETNVGQVDIKTIEDTKNRIRRIFAGGLSEWQERDDPRRIPFP